MSRSEMRSRGESRFLSFWRMSHIFARPQILLDLLLASRHLSSIPSTSDADSSKPTAGRHPLTSIVLDTLLCVLVDSSPALRAFEESNGPQAVVKILKRAGTPREVRCVVPSLFSSM